MQRKLEENNRIDLFKKSGDINGLFHAKMGIIKDRNGKELKETEHIKKRWQEDT